MERLGYPPEPSEHGGARFLGYIRDEAGTPIGIEMAYDGGHGYGYDHSDSRVTLYPGPEVHLPYMYSIDLEDGDWFESTEFIPVNWSPSRSRWTSGMSRTKRKITEKERKSSWKKSISS
ncbi:MAG: hypothetical protein LIO78_01180 [Clostridiales bacterium]|nr:hypothetical protein [Clostridiales bacterium]